MQDLRDLLFEAAEEGVAVGTISQEVFDEKIVPNKDTYATYAVLDYFNGRVSAGIKQQIGTVKGTANPYTAMILKTMAMHRLNERQKFVTAILATIDQGFYGEQGKEQVIDRYNRKKDAGPDKENLLYFVDGKLHYREVDEYIASMLESHDIGGLKRAAQIAGSVTYGVFHPLYVVYSAAWQVRNIQRDTKRTYINLGAAHAGKPTLRQALEAVLDLGRLPAAYSKTIGPAWRNARQKRDPYIRQMLQDRALGRAFHSFTPHEADTTLERLLQQYGILEPEHGGALRRNAAKIPAISATAGVFQEVWSKAAAYKILGEMGITGRKRAFIVRNYTGTPDSTQRGLGADISNTMFMYANVILAGVKSDAEVAFQPSSAAGFWTRSVIADFGLKALMAAAALGLFGDDLKEWFKRIPSYDLEKYIIMPIPPFWAMNKRGDKKAVYLRIPHGDSQRILAATVWALFTGERPYSTAHAASIFSGEFPGFNPAITMLTAAKQMFFDNRNPYDTFRGREIVPRTNWEAGGWQRNKELLRWAAGEFGILSQMAGGLIYGSPEESEAAEDVWGPLGEQGVRSIPGLSSLIKISDRGLNEGNYWETDWDQQERARLRSTLDKSVFRATSERSRLNNLRGTRTRKGESLSDADESRRQSLNAWYNTFYQPLLQEMARAKQAEDKVAFEDAKTQLNESTTEARTMTPSTRLPSGTTRPPRPVRP